MFEYGVWIGNLELMHKCFPKHLYMGTMVENTLTSEEYVCFSVPNFDFNKIHMKF